MHMLLYVNAALANRCPDDGVTPNLSSSEGQLKDQSSLQEVAPSYSQYAPQKLPQ